MGEVELFSGRQVLGFSTQSDRREFLRYAGLVGVGATLAVGGAVPAWGSQPVPRHRHLGGDVGVLNFALTLEYLEADFYARGLRCGILSGRERALVEPIGDHEVQHVAGLKELIESMGADPVDKPAFRYPFLTFRSSSSFLRQARKFEELGVHAYHGQVPLISDPEVLAAAASIAGVESRHAAILDKLTWNDPFPAPIEKPYKKTRVLSEVDPYIVDAGSKREEAGR